MFQALGSFVTRFLGEPSSMSGAIICEELPPRTMAAPVAHPSAGKRTGLDSCLAYGVQCFVHLDVGSMALSEAGKNDLDCANVERCLQDLRDRRQQAKDRAAVLARVVHRYDRFQ